MDKVVKFLEEHQSPEPSQWKEQAKWRRENKCWLKHARSIAIQMLEAMKEQDIDTTELGERLVYGAEVMNTILKGQHNLTLAMIADLEEVLGIKIINNAFEDGGGDTD